LENRRQLNYVVSELIAAAREGSKRFRNIANVNEHDNKKSKKKKKADGLIANSKQIAICRLLISAHGKWRQTEQGFYFLFSNTSRTGAGILLTKFHPNWRCQRNARAWPNGKRRVPRSYDYLEKAARRRECSASYRLLISNPCRIITRVSVSATLMPLHPSPRAYSSKRKPLIMSLCSRAARLRSCRRDLESNGPARR